MHGAVNRSLCLIFAFIFFMVMLEHWHIAELLFIPPNPGHTGWRITAGTASVLFFVLNGVCVYGFLKKRTWRFTLAYVTVILCTLAFACSYIPFFDYLLRFHATPYAAFATNGLLLLVMMVYHARLR